METLSMSGKERRRLEVLFRVKAREFSLAKAAKWLSREYRSPWKLEV